jgi:hypothetical protein
MNEDEPPCFKEESYWKLLDIKSFRGNFARLSKNQTFQFVETGLMNEVFREYSYIMLLNSAMRRSLVSEHFILKHEGAGASVITRSPVLAFISTSLLSM